MFSTFTLSIRIKIATYAPELICCFSDLYHIRNRIICPFHKRVIYVNRPCSVCGFVKRLSQKKLQQLHDHYRSRKRRKLISFSSHAIDT